MRFALAAVLAGAVLGFGTVRADAAETHVARGVVVSFGRSRNYVNIAHDKIDGYMEPMTMSFEPRRPAQIAGLSKGDNVTFTFTVEGDHRYLDEISKR